MSEPITTETVLKAVSLIGAGASWLYTTRATNLRAKIKADFEVLKMSRDTLGADHELSQRIEAKLGQMVPYLYRKDSERKGRVRWDDLALACFCLLGAGTF